MRILFLGLLWVCGCDAIQKTDHFPIEVSTSVRLAAATAEEPALTFPDLPGLAALDLSRSEAFTARDHGPEDVARTRLTSFELTATDPPGRDLSFLGELRLYVEADGQPRKLLARAADFATGPNRRTFQVTEDDLTPWFVGTPGRVSIEAIRSDRPPQQTTLELRLLFEVEVQVL